MELSQLFLVAVFVLAGLFAIIASVLNVDWFFNNRKIAVYVRLLGQTGARIFYVLVGIGLTVAGIYFYRHGF
ncbi:MAG: immunity 17 family protein [Tannerellaceae bacterium]|jgi:hypothetical protein|nr:immunity 17 family protein [Tannerellaceae bacterium]